MEQTATPKRHYSRALRVYRRAVNRIADIGICLAAILVLADLSLIGPGIAMRYLFNRPIGWSDELVAISLAAIVLFSAPKVLLQGEHIGVDIITGNLRGRAQIIARIWSAVAVLAVSALLIFNGWSTAMLSRTIRLVTEGQLELPVWILQLVVPVGGIALALAATAQLWAALETWRLADHVSSTA